MSDAPAKPDLVLIHGWGLGSAAWDPALAPLEQRFRVRRLALPGYDRADSGVNERSSQFLDGKASFIETATALTDSLPAGACLCGWSLGSMLALQMAALAPQRVARLILVGSTPSFMQRADWQPAQPPALLDSFRDAVTADAGATLQRFVAVLNQGDSQARANGRTLSRQLLASRLPDAATLLTGLGWLRDVDLREQIASVATPTLLIHGENDPLMPLAAARWLHAKLPDSQLKVIAGAAHAPFLNDTEGFAKLIGDHCHASAPA